MNVTDFRIDFPALRKKVIYLNNFNSCLKPEIVINCLRNYYEKEYDVHDEITRSIKTVKKFINAYDRGGIIFTNNLGDSINTIYEKSGIKKDDKIVLTNLEENNNLINWYELIKNKKLKYDLFKAAKVFSSEKFKELITKDTKIVCIPHISSCSGITLPVKEICDYCHEKNIKVVINASYSSAHKTINISEWNADFVLLNPDYLCGPEGISILYAKDEEDDYCKDYKGIICAGKGIKYLHNLGMEDIMKHEKRLVKRLYKGLENDNIDIISKDGPLINIVVKNILNKKVRELLIDSNNIHVSSGLNCEQWCKDNNIKDSVLVCPYFYNTMEEVELFMKDLNNIIS